MENKEAIKRVIDEEDLDEFSNAFCKATTMIQKCDASIGLVLQYYTALQLNTEDNIKDSVDDPELNEALLTSLKTRFDGFKYDQTYITATLLHPCYKHDKKPLSKAMKDIYIEQLFGRNITFIQFTIITVVIISIAYFVLHQSSPDKQETPAVKKRTNCKLSDKQYQESAYAHQLLDNLTGIEIGASSYSPFCLDTINVNYSNDTAIFREEELKITGTYVPVDVVASGDNLPFANDTYDFVINGHVIEHFYDPVKAIQEWLRVVKKGGYVFMIIPHKERTFDKVRNRTTINEIIQRHEKKPPADFVDDHGHHSVWMTEDFIEICLHYKWKIHSLFDTDDKGGISFTVVLQKQ